MVVSEKEQKQEKEDFEKIRQETGALIGECFKMYMKVPPEQPEQEKKMKMKRTKPKINGVHRLLFALNLTN